MGSLDLDQVAATGETPSKRGADVLRSTIEGIYS
jgi:hypothetical protein